MNNQEEEQHGITTSPPENNHRLDNEDESTCPQCCGDEPITSTSPSSGSRREEQHRRHGERSQRSSSSSNRHRSRSSRDRRRRHRRSRQQSNTEENTTNSNNTESSSGVTSTAAMIFTPEEEAKRVQVGQWPHGLSFLFAALACTMSFFTISRFAVLTSNFGFTFLVQFLLISLLFGIPLMTLHASLGQYLGSGVVDMWRISPIFQGIGVSLMISQGLLGSNGIACISWLFIYLRDSSITTFDRYRWSHCHHDSAYGRTCEADYFNNTVRIEQSLADYFAGMVLQRSSPNYPNSTLGHLKFQTVFNMLVIWMVIFMGLSKGLKSYGKVAYIFGIFPLLGFLVFAAKLLSILSYWDYKYYFLHTNWSHFITNKNSWICAARECFLVWSLLGASILQLSSHNKFKHRLARDTTIISIITLIVLVISGLMGVAAVKVIIGSGYDYQVSSYETSKSYEFLSFRSSNDILKYVVMPTAYDNTKSEHISFVSGVRILEPGRDPDLYSGYQVMRLATEIVPAFATVLGPRLFSPFWVVLFYFSFILFGLGQQMALWHTVVSGVIAIKPETLKAWQTCITFSCCIVGFILGLPMATEIGVFILYFLDYTIGCGWWLMILYAAQSLVVFGIRGSPYSSRNVVSVLFKKSKTFGMGWILAFMWTLVLPVLLLFLVSLSFRTGRLLEMFDWTIGTGYLYLPSWVREIGAMMQIIPLLLIPFVGVIQSCRYFLHGPENLLERIHLLYRPTYANSRTLGRRSANRPEVILVNYNSNTQQNRNDDPPPKYTPPPSYSTATGARIAQFIRQSFRQSIRILRGPASTSDKDEEQPPDYASVIIETANTQPPPPTEDYFSPSSSCSSCADEEEFPHVNHPTNIVLDGSELNSVHQSSRTETRRNSVRGPSLESFNLQRVDSETVLVQSAEPMDLSPSLRLKSSPSTSSNEDSISFCPSTLSLGESVIFVDEDEFIHPNSTAALNGEVSSSSNEVEAVNHHYSSLNENSPRHTQQQSSDTLFLQIDTSTSVI
uniref:Uncharacterized protein n=1 Tax=Lepeophtheirus salmonis TaxID=72036 RepID=A0A0K2TZK3_LEPSM